MVKNIAGNNEESLSKGFSTRKLSKRSYALFYPKASTRTYLYVLLSLVLLCALVHPYPQAAMWLAFMLAGYSAVANDSIQTIGTFICSNSRKYPWYALWLFMGLIFGATILYSWLTNSGDISYRRLSTPGLDTAPASFSFLQLAAPLLLLLLTRLRMPVSTSILLLSAFSTKASSIGGILAKSLVGYVLAFTVAFLVWLLLSYIWGKYFTLSKKPAWWWVPLQWIISGTLWSVWIMQDMANIAVVLPRQLALYELLAVFLYIFAGLGFLFYLKGDKIQHVIAKKTNVADVRMATLIDFVYALLLYYFKVVSTIPISTTWVFIGLLGGRELGMSCVYIFKKTARKKRLRKSIRLISKDVFYAGIGLLVSLALTLAINEGIRRSFWELIGIQ